MVRGSVRSVTVTIVTVLAATAAVAQTPTPSPASDPSAGYPRQPIKIVVGFTPGGSNDLIGRLMAQKLGERLGQPAVVENKPGAGAIIGAEYVARSAPDGYTILIAPAGTMSINPAVYTHLPYDALASFEMIANVATYPFVLSVNASHPAKSVAELVAWGKTHPSEANYGSTSAIFQLTSELFKSKTGTTFEFIPFKSGGEVVTAILSGQVTMAFADTGPLLPQVKAGKLRSLATSGAARMAELPEVPTMAEAGYPDVTVEGYTGLVAPKGTPPGIVGKLETAVVEILKQAEVRERLAQLGTIPSGETGAEFRARIAREIPLWTAVAKAAHIKLD